MANYVEIIIDLKGQKKDVEKVLENVLVTPEYVEQVRQRNEKVDVPFRIECAKVGEIDINMLIPQPTNVHNLGLNKEIKEKYGSGWYDWRFQNWGSGWNVADTYFADWLDDNCFSLEFDTKWNVPTIWVEKLSELCKENNVEINGKYANEDFLGPQGRFSNESGELEWDETQEDKELFESLWGEGILDDEE